MNVDRSSLTEQVLELIISEGQLDRSKITPTATLESLEVQSIDVVMILLAIEEKFGVYIPIDGAIAEAKDLTGFVDNVVVRIVENRV